MESTGVPPRLALVVCTRGRPQELERLLQFLAAQDWPVNSWLVVVDNDPRFQASLVATAAAASFPVPIQIESEPIEGYATARNVALDRVENAATICFLDDDAVVPPNWLAVMAATSLSHPLALVRSRYAHVAHLPSDPWGAAEKSHELLQSAGLGPAGTSGLLIPAAWRSRSRFDRYFDISGGEDMDLLYRLRLLGCQEVLADTLAFEQQRTSSLALRAQLEHAIWSGRLTVIVRQRSGQSTVRLRSNALTTCCVALGISALRFVMGRRAAATGHFTLAASRWGMVSARWKAPAVLGRRPVS